MILQILPVHNITEMPKWCSLQLLWSKYVIVLLVVLFTKVDELTPVEIIPTFYTDPFTDIYNLPMLKIINKIKTYT